MFKLLFLSSLVFLSIIKANSDYAPSSDCKDCHTQIYDEYTKSMHANATPQKDPIHGSVWDRHPKNLKFQKYGCGKCHTPTAPKNSMPTMDSKVHQEAISCAYCHRIKSIELHAKSNTNIMSETPRNYFGTMKSNMDSPYHGTIKESNEHIINGNVCIGCHSHKKNKHQLNVCSTNIDNEMNDENCVSCHMPKVAGSVSVMHETKKHAFHGFPGSHFNSEMLAKYVNIDATVNKKDFSINIKNHTSHAMLLHPLRVAVLKTSVKRGTKTFKQKDEIFVRVIGHEGKPAMPWRASVTLKDTMIQAKETRVVKYDFEIKKGDEISIVLGWYLVNPKALKELGLENDEVATKFTVFKKQTFKGL